VRVNTNVVAINSRAKLDRNISEVDRENRRLATGDRINKAAYDPAGLIISENMKARIRSYGQAQRNANDSVSLIQVAEGALGTIQEMAIRMKELAMQSANDTLGDEDRAYVNGEYQNMKNEIKRIVSSTKFNGRDLLDTNSGNYQFQVGIHGDGPGQQVNYDMGKVIRSADKLMARGSHITTKGSSQVSLNAVNDMLKEVSGARAFLGATQNRVQSTIQNLQISQENTAAANSRIRDTDVAQSTAQRAISTIKTNAATGFLSHANGLPDKAKLLLE
jgi:flagellin